MVEQCVRHRAVEQCGGRCMVGWMYTGSMSLSLQTARVIKEYMYICMYSATDISEGISLGTPQQMCTCTQLTVGKHCSLGTQTT